MRSYFACSLHGSEAFVGLKGGQELNINGAEIQAANGEVGFPYLLSGPQFLRFYNRWLEQLKTSIGNCRKSTEYKLLIIQPEIKFNAFYCYVVIKIISWTRCHKVVLENSRFSHFSGNSWNAV